MSLTPEAVHTRLPTRWRRLARLTWLVLVALLLWLSAYDIWRLIAAGQTATWLLVWRIVMPLGFLTIGGVVFWRKMDDWLGLLTSFALIGVGVTLLSGVGNDLLRVPGWRLAASFLQGITTGSFVVLVFVFPDGHFAPAWARPVGLAAMVLPLASVIFTMGRLAGHVDVTLFLAWVMLGLALQVYRFIRISGPVQRQQSKWVVAGLLCPVVIIFIWFAVNASSRDQTQVQAGLQLFLPVLFILALGLPLALAFSILRYRLWDIDLLINRALVFGALTLLLALGYFGAVVVLQAVFQAVAGQARSELVTVLSTLIVAALFGPLRNRLQAAIDRRFYRRKYDAARTLAEFYNTVRDDVELEQLTDHLTLVVEETLQPETVSLWLYSPESEVK
jgi:hypothetical protein